MAVSFKIDGNEINGVDGRRCHGQIVDTRTGAGIREISISGLITGTSVQNLQDLWEAAKVACNTTDKGVTVKIDSSTTNYLEDMFSGDGRTVKIFTFISGDERRIGTGTTMPFIVTAVVSEALIAPSTGTSPAGLTTYKGQVGDWKKTITYSEARIESRGFVAQFATFFDKEAYGPFTISSVANDSGFAQFVVTTAPPTFKVGQRLYVSGGTLYNNVHEITAIDVGNKKITTATSFAGTDTGVANLGEATTPQENYENNRAAILADQLGVGTDGTRDTTTGLVLLGESTGQEQDLYTVILNSGWVEKSYDDDIRNLSIAFSEAYTTDWPNLAAAGDPPEVYGAVITFSVDKDNAGDDNPVNMWKTIRSAVITDVKALVNSSEVAGPYDEQTSYDKKTGVVTVNMSFLARNTTVFRFSRVYHTHDELQYTTWKAGEYDIIQTSTDPVIRIVTASVTRVGVGEIDLTPDPPTEPGYTYLEISRDDSAEAPIVRRGISETVYTQSLTIAWRRFKMRGGGNPRVRNPVTG